MRARLITWLAGALSSLALAAAVPLAAAETVREPEGYRSAPYRALVPATLAGATVLTTGEAKSLWDAGEAVFVDVLPRPPRPANLPEGTLWSPKPRDNIPGSVWLPNTGYDRLSDETAAYFAAGLHTATGGAPERPLVLYCLADCWMSWNAAKRALALGYGNVHWYPEGTDAWAAAGHPLAPSEPLSVSP